MGSMDFTDMMYEGHPEWYIFAVEGTLDSVTDEFVRLRKAKRVFRGVGIGRLRKHELIGMLTPIVELVDSGWVVVLRAMNYVTSQQLEEYREDAKHLSKRLKRRAIAFATEDTSGMMAYELYNSGKSIEQAEWERGGEECRFTSTRRKLPKREDYHTSFADEIFRELGIYVPVCVGRREPKPCLAVGKGSAGAIKCANLVELEKWG